MQATTTVKWAHKKKKKGQPAIKKCCKKEKKNTCKQKRLTLHCVLTFAFFPCVLFSVHSFLLYPFLPRLCFVLFTFNLLCFLTSLSLFGVFILSFSLFPIIARSLPLVPYYCFIFSLFPSLIWLSFSPPHIIVRFCCPSFPVQSLLFHVMPFHFKDFLLASVIFSPFCYLWTNVVLVFTVMELSQGWKQYMKLKTMIQGKLNISKEFTKFWFSRLEIFKL